MRNRITLLIILIAIVLLLFSTIHGINIGSFEVLSVSQIQEKNNELNEKIDSASTLTSVTYPGKIETLEETFDRYTIQKQKYEELAGFADEKSNEKYETKQYDISYLWRVLGKYATSRNLTLGIDVKASNGSSDLYDLNFAVSGQYVNISQFITDLENDSDLYFRIYDFKMNGSGVTITSTFTVKGIRIDPSTLTKANSETTTDTTQTDTNS